MDNEKFTGISASSGDCTGLIPSGGDHTPDEIENYQNIIPYTAPGLTKGISKAELEKIKKLNR